MIFLKNYFVTTTQEIDFIPIIHDVRFAIKDSQMPQGLATITIPQRGAGLLVTSLEKKELEIAKEKFRQLEGINLSLSIPFQKNELILDPQQMIYLVDFSSTGKRREFYLQVMGETPPQPGGPNPPNQPPGRKHP